jgi:hypothetical protein
MSSVFLVRFMRLVRLAQAAGTQMSVRGHTFVTCSATHSHGTQGHHLSRGWLCLARTGMMKVNEVKEVGMTPNRSAIHNPNPYPLRRGASILV